MKQYLLRATKINDRLSELAGISDDPAFLTRVYGSPAFIKGRDLVKKWMTEAGMQVTIDNIGNVRGRVASDNPKAKTFVIGSHIDTVINAGKYDGPLGILVGIDIIEDIIQQKSLLPFNIELIAFCDEEGVRFHTTYLGSKAVTGKIDDNLLDNKDDENISLRQAIEVMGGNVADLPKDMINAEDWLGYFEIHIEQGPVLYERNIPVAIVSSIAGQERIEITFTGQGGHAGTVPMNMRKDALCAAAEFIVAAEKYAALPKHQVIATVGRVDIVNAASNVIPGTVKISFDIRSGIEDQLSIAYEALNAICEEICFRRNLYYNWKLVQESKTVVCDEKMNMALGQSIQDAGFDVVNIPSGAGHDAVAIAQVSPVAMLFVKCTKGISHHPQEEVELEDIAAAVQVAENFLQNFTFRK